MPEVSILARDPSVIFPAPEVAQEVVAVTYSAPAIPPRIIQIPIANYRLATPEELRANPRYRMVPKDAAAARGEQDAIAQDVQRAVAGRPHTFTVP